MADAIDAGVMDKSRLLKLLLERLRAQLAALEASQQAAQAGAVHEESRAEHPKDTRAIEATYLARGLAERTETLREAIATLSGLTLPVLDPRRGVVVTALVSLEDDEGDTAHYLLLPVAGGEKLAIDRLEVQTLTPGSPLGRRLMGREPGTEIVFERPRCGLHATLVGLR